MPQLLDVRKTKTIKSVVDGGEITFFEGLLAGDIEKVAAVDQSKRAVFSIALMIKDWNFEDEEGKKLPVTPENVAKLDMRDIKIIQKMVEENGDDKDFLDQGN